MDDLELLKVLILESKYPLFSDEELSTFLELNENNIYKTASELCIMTADGEESITVRPITIKNASKDFWINLSQKYYRKHLETEDSPNKYVVKMKRKYYD